MLSRRLDENGDYSFGQNNNDFISGIDAVAQNIKTKLSLFQGEWWEDQNDGLPVFQAIIGQFNIENVKIAATRLITERIMQVESVISVEEMNVQSNDETRSIYASYIVNTEFGTVEGEVNF